MPNSMCGRAILIVVVVSYLTGTTIAGASQPLSQAASKVKPHSGDRDGVPRSHHWHGLSATSHDGGQPELRRRLQQEGEPTGVAAWDPRIHGYVATISIGLLGPLAVVVSRNFREFRPVWIWVHALLAVVALIGGIVGVVFGAKLPDDANFIQSVYSAHKGIGGVAVALYGIQVLMALFRPKPDHQRRKVFNIVHHWTGRLGIALGIINVFLGLHLAEELYKFWWGYAIVLGCIMLLWLAKEVLDLFAVLKSNRRGPNSTKPAEPVNGSFASRFLLHGRPVPGEPDTRRVSEGPRKAASLVNGHTNQSEGIQMSRV